jgi:hypothetical protein
MGTKKLVAGMLCLTALVSLLSAGAASGSDELVWRALVDICQQTSGVPSGADSPVSWRLWFTQDEIYPKPSQGVPVSDGIFSTSRPLICQLQRQQQKLFSLGRSERTIDNQPECEAVFLNQPAVKYILDNLLYDRKKLITLATGSTGVHFPAGETNPSREIKTEWRQISPSQFGSYVVAVDGAAQTYGLVALHLMTHETAAGWTWATWIHTDYRQYVPDSYFHDSFGVGSDGKISNDLQHLLATHNEPYLANYLLIGSQTGLTSPATLGNPLIEGTDLGSFSCMGCHTYAAILASGSWPSPPDHALVGNVQLPANRYSLDFDYSLANRSKCGLATGIQLGCSDAISMDDR